MKKTEQITSKTLLQIRKEVQELKLASKFVLTLKEVIDYKGYSKSYMYRRVSNGQIPFSKPNAEALFFERKKVGDWLLSNRYSSRKENQQKAKNFLINS